MPFLEVTRQSQGTLCDMDETERNTFKKFVDNNGFAENLFLLCFFLNS